MTREREADIGADRGSDAADDETFECNTDDCFDLEHEELFTAGSAHASDAAPHDFLLPALDTEPFDTELRDSGIEPFDTEAMCTNNLDDEFDLGAAP